MKRKNIKQRIKERCQAGESWPDIELEKRMKQLIKQIKKHKFSYLFLLPSFSAFVLFGCYPLICTFIYSFHRYTLKSYNYIGLKNYINLLGDPTFLKAMKNTLFFVVTSTPLILFISIIVAALIIKMNEKLRTFFMLAFYLPNITSIVTLALVWKWIYDYRFGILNYVMSIFGYESINWMSNKYTVLPSLMFFLVYLCLGMPIILLTASMAAIPKTYYDAAKIDGATDWQILWKITVPLIRPTLLYLMIVLMIGSSQTFIIIVLMTGGGPYYRTTTLAYQIADEAFQFSHFGVASTIGVILLFVVSILTLIQYKFLSRDIQY